MMNKRLLLTLTLSFMLAVATVGCSAKDTANDSNEKNETVNVDENRTEIEIAKDENVDSTDSTVLTDLTDVTEQGDSEDGASKENDTSDSETNTTDSSEKNNANGSKDKVTSTTNSNSSNSKTNSNANTNTNTNASTNTSTNNTTIKPSGSNESTSSTQNKPSSENVNTETTEPQESQEPSTPVHTHTWTEVTETVTHEENGHYETKVVKEAWVEEHYDWRTICGVCQTDLTDMDYTDMVYHVCAICGGGYYVGYIKVGETQHPAETEEVWVVDEPASTETVIIGYKCSCGAAKEN